MKIDIECIHCNTILTGKELVKQSLAQTKSQMSNWRVWLGLKRIDYIVITIYIIRAHIV